MSLSNCISGGTLYCHAEDSGRNRFGGGMREKLGALFENVKF